MNSVLYAKPFSASSLLLHNPQHLSSSTPEPAPHGCSHDNAILTLSFLRGLLLVPPLSTGQMMRSAFTHSSYLQNMHHHHHGYLLAPVVTMHELVSPAKNTPSLCTIAMHFSSGYSEPEVQPGPLLFPVTQVIQYPLILTRQINYNLNEYILLNRNNL